jgi:hypothetical protein
MNSPNINTWKLVAALQVIVLDPAIARFLEKTDPQALKQAQQALRDHFNEVEETHFSDFELR